MNTVIQILKALARPILLPVVRFVIWFCEKWLTRCEPQGEEITSTYTYEEVKEKFIKILKFEDFEVYEIINCRCKNDEICVLVKVAQHFDSKPYFIHYEEDGRQTYGLDTKETEIEFAFNLIPNEEIGPEALFYIMKAASNTEQMQSHKTLTKETDVDSVVSFLKEKRDSFIEERSLTWFYSVDSKDEKLIHSLRSKIRREIGHKTFFESIPNSSTTILFIKWKNNILKEDDKYAIKEITDDLFLGRIEFARN